MFSLFGGIDFRVLAPLSSSSPWLSLADFQENLFVYAGENEDYEMTGDLMLPSLEFDVRLTDSASVIGVSKTVAEAWKIDSVRPPLDDLRQCPFAVGRMSVCMVVAVHASSLRVGLSPSEGNRLCVDCVLETSGLDLVLESLNLTGKSQIVAQKSPRFELRDVGVSGSVWISEVAEVQFAGSSFAGDVRIEGAGNVFVEESKIVGHLGVSLMLDNFPSSPAGLYFRNVLVRDAGVFDQIWPIGGGVLVEVAGKRRSQKHPEFQLRLDGLRVTKNRASRFGGGLALMNGGNEEVSLTLLSGSRSWIERNQAMFGGGLYIGPGIVLDTSELLASIHVDDNSANLAGGAIFLDSSALEGLAWVEMGGNSAPFGSEVLGFPTHGSLAHTGYVCNLHTKNCTLKVEFLLQSDSKIEPEVFPCRLGKSMNFSVVVFFGRTEFRGQIRCGTSPATVSPLAFVASFGELPVMNESLFVVFRSDGAEAWRQELSFAGPGPTPAVIPGFPVWEIAIVASSSCLFLVFLATLLSFVVIVCCILKNRSLGEEDENDERRSLLFGGTVNEPARSQRRSQAFLAGIDVPSVTMTGYHSDDGMCVANFVVTICNRRRSRIGNSEMNVRIAMTLEDLSRSELERVTSDEIDVPALSGKNGEVQVLLACDAPDVGLLIGSSGFVVVEAYVSASSSPTRPLSPKHTERITLEKWMGLIDGFGIVAVYAIPVRFEQRGRKRFRSRLVEELQKLYSVEVSTSSGESCSSFSCYELRLRKCDVRRLDFDELISIAGISVMLSRTVPRFLLARKQVDVSSEEDSFVNFSDPFGMARQGHFASKNGPIPIVVKQGSYTDFRRFLRKIEVLAGLDHSNILKCHGCWFEGDAYFLVLEDCTGMIEAVRRLPYDPTDTAKFRLPALLELARAMECLHLSGLVGSDLSASSLLISDVGEVKFVGHLSEEATVVEKGCDGSMGEVFDDVDAFGVLALEWMDSAIISGGSHAAALKEIVRRCCAEERSERILFTEIVGILEEIRL